MTDKIKEGIGVQIRDMSRVVLELIRELQSEQTTAGLCLAVGSVVCTCLCGRLYVSNLIMTIVMDVFPWFGPRRVIYLW